MIAKQTDRNKKLNIKQLHKLNNKQKRDIRKLVQECLLFDRLERTLYLSNDLNVYENLKSFYLLYDSVKLVSVLTIFQTKETEAELSAYTLPEERNKGYFTALLDCAEDELIGFDIVRVLFVVEPRSTSGTFALAAFNAKYLKSEYLLKLDSSDWIHLPKQSMEIAEVKTQNLTETAILSATIFGIEIKEALLMLADVQESEKVENYCAYIGDDMVGKCSVNYGDNSASIFGFGISPQLQGKGYGKELLNLLLTKVTEQNIRYITLEVGSENQRAFSLYKSVGFQIKTQYNYYEHLIEFEEIN